MLRALKKEVDTMQEQEDKVSREMETLRKNQKEMTKINNTVTDMKNALDGFISRLNTGEKIISEFEDMSI